MSWQWLKMQPFVRKWSSGQGLVEYALLLILVGVIMIAVVTVLGPELAETYQKIIDAIDAVV